MHSKKILVTGGTGFVGSYLLRYLVAQGYDNIRALHRPGSSFALVAEVADKVEWMEGDVLDVAALDIAMQGVRQVYHCAALVSFQEKDNREMIRANRDGTANLVNIALEAGIEKLLHVSSIAALGRTPGSNTVSEQTKWQSDNWNSPYGLSKHLAEMEVWRGAAEGLNVVIVNPSNVLGSGFWKGRTSTGQLFHQVWNGLPFYPLGGSGFVDVRDVARFSVRLMESDITGQRFILNGENLPFRSVLNQIAAVLQVKPPYIEVTPLLRETAWRLAWLYSKISGKPAFITKQTSRMSSRTFYYDASKSLAALDFSYIPISDTIRQTGAQFLASVSKGFEPAVLDF
ncbi:MAG: hypothetical protein RI973_2212 [Bacteroidota bacterium]|jgi:nucleoside-diphosphate-sugar epimerase